MMSIFTITRLSLSVAVKLGRRYDIAQIKITFDRLQLNQDCSTNTDGNFNYIFLNKGHSVEPCFK